MAGMGFAQMSSILSLQSMLKSAVDANRNRNMMQSEMGVLGSQIKADQDRGVNTKRKEEQYAALEEGANSLLGQIQDVSENIADKIAEDSEAIREEEAAKAAEEKAAAEKAAKTAKTGKTAETTAVNPSAPTAVTAPGETPAAVVEISPMARKAAAAAPAPVPEIPVTQPAATGVTTNVKA